ncbi:hypothetical protein C7447_103193 [Tenacibaculum adriaticum]|uniref:Calx-beta domain-containing protein n=1 Tax=Tenacibaculum adriaticum TaxID=413713 RepID=A0A5S5DQL9_9FLAO|nr:hypothetical protein [Tenacibaculum adriaticum]TYP98025.1 hypothetical protein C7447_103193 [Tenacibaculum adriaticum]
MKYKFLKATFAIGALALMVACDDDKYTGASTLEYVAPTVTITSANGFDITTSENDIPEDDGLTYTIEASITEAVQADLVLDIKQIGGTSVEHSDFETSGYILIPAGSTSGSGTVTVYKTGNAEPNETLTLSIGANEQNFKGSETLKISMSDDYINDVLEVTADWSGEFTYTASVGQVTIDLCDIDIDVVLLTETGGLVDYTAATASCPESGTISGLADGKYLLALDLYENPFVDLNANGPVPVTITYSQEYNIEATSFVYSGFTTDTAPTTIIAAEIEVVNGYVYTVNPL